ncbi:MAG: phospholipase D-like domain-containing protein [Psychrobacter sp.]|nr:phospholipase D-like domain-containing protein [Psychrobacter sp.]
MPDQVFEAWSWLDLAELGLIAHILVMVLLTLRILSVQRNVGVAIAWLAILYTLPLFGLITYILIGEPMIGRRYLQRTEQARALLNEMAERERLVFDQGEELLTETYRGVSRIGTVWTGFGVYDDHQMRLLVGSDQIFSQLLEDISSARQIILMEFYIVYPEGQVRAILEALAAAAKRGVDCHLVADSVGSFNFFGSPLHKALIKSGVEIHQSLPVGLFRTLFKRTDVRNHRKIVVIDEDIGYTGSFNLVDPKHFKQNKKVGQWIDVMMRIHSRKPMSVITAMTKVVATDIGAESNSNLDALDQRINAYTRKLYLMNPAINDVDDTANPLMRSLRAMNQSTTSKAMIQTLPMPAVESVVAQLIPSAPQITAHVIYNTLVTVIHRADQRIQITTPYFVPDEALLGALTTAAKRGVEVTLIIPKKVDSFMVQHASQAYYAELLEAGVTIALFTGGLLHAKTVVVDNDYCLFGTVNIDMRSFYLNMEVSLAIYTPQMVAQVAACQQSYLQLSDILTQEQWSQRQGYKRLFDNGMRLFSPLL